MPTITPKRMASVLLGNTPTVIYQAPTSPTTTGIPRIIEVTNVDPPNLHQLTMWVVPNGGNIAAPIDDHLIAKLLDVSRNASRGLTTVNAGDTIVGKGDVADVFAVYVGGSDAV